MKKILSFLLGIMLMTTSLFGCGDDSSAVNPMINLSSEAINLQLFSETELVADCKDVESIVWENSNEEIVKLQTSGFSTKVIAVGSGLATITAKSGDVKKSCVVNVPYTTQQLSLSMLGYDSLDLRVGGEIYVPAKAMFGNQEFSKANIVYSTDNPSIATVSEEGLVNALNVGTTTLKVRAEYYGKYSNEVDIGITVSSGLLYKVNAANLSLYAAKEGDNVEFFPNTHELAVSIKDGQTEIENVDYSIENTNEAVATINNGVITALSAGETEFFITSEYEGETLTATIYVKVESVPQASINIQEDSIKLYTEAPTASYIGQQQLTPIATLSGKLIPSSELTWSVIEGSGIVSVSEKGIVRGIRKGKAKVALNYDFAGKTYSDVCEVEVAEPFTYVDGTDLWDREGVYASVFKGSQLVYDEFTLIEDENTPFIRFNLIPETAPLSNEPSNVNQISNRMIRMMYITLSEVDNPNNYVMIAVRVAFDAAEILTVANVGVRASSFPAYTYGALVGYTGFYGRFRDTVHSSMSPIDISGGYGCQGAKFSFYGKHLSDTTNKYAIGLAISGTSIYLHNNDTVRLIWDLEADTKEFAAFGTHLSESNAWSGFNSNKVKISISSGHYNTTGPFNIMITDIAGREATAQDLTKLTIKEI